MEILTTAIIFSFGLVFGCAGGIILLVLIGMCIDYIRDRKLKTDEQLDEEFIKSLKK